jgi:hypothetical protein
MLDYQLDQAVFPIFFHPLRNISFRPQGAERPSEAAEVAFEDDEGDDICT